MSAKARSAEDRRVSKIAEPADINVDELRRRARRRLVGAVVLALAVAVVVPMLLETDQKPLGDDVAVKIPPVDEGKFVNRLNDPQAAPAQPQDASPATPPAAPATPEAPTRGSKYDTRVPEPASTPPSAVAAPTVPGASSPSTTSAPSAKTQADESAVPAKSTGGQAPAATASTGSAREAPAAANPAPPEKSSASTAKRSDATERAVGSAEKPVIITDKSSPAEHAKASVHREGFAVQLAAFADDKGANSLAGRLKRAGYAAYTEPLKTSKGTLWRVRVGPYPSREAAVAARDKLKTEGQNGIVAAIR